MCGDSPINEHLKGSNSLECLVKVAVSLDGGPGKGGEQGVQGLLQLGDVRHQQRRQALAYLAQHSGMFIQQVLQIVCCVSYFGPCWYTYKYCKTFKLFRIIFLRNH